MFGLVSISRYQPPLKIALLKAFTHCDFQKETPDAGTALPGVCGEQSKDEDCSIKGKHASVPHFLLLGKDSSSEGAAICYSVSGWAFYLEAAQNLEVTNIGWSVIPFPLFFLSQPLGPLPSVYCLREMQLNLAFDLEPICCVHTRDDSEKICLHVFNLDLPCWQNETNL